VQQQKQQIPLPSDETTPPVTKIKWVIEFLVQSSRNRPTMLGNFTVLCPYKAKSNRINSKNYKQLTILSAFSIKIYGICGYFIHKLRLMYKNNFRSEINSFEDFDHIAISTDTLMQAFIKYQQTQ
jgi:hypothetical protein